MTETGKGFVFIVESPSEDDLLDDRTEGKTLEESLKLSNTSCRYSLVTSRRSFFTAINEKLPQACKVFRDDPPIIHLSMHGNEHGIGLTNGDFVNWDELRNALMPINNKMQQGLLICMSSCFGSAGCRMAMYSDNVKPFWALVGNNKAAKWNDAAVAYVAFYHRLFNGAAIETAVQAMKTASGDSHFCYLSGSEVKSGWVSYLSKKPSNVLG